MREDQADQLIAAVQNLTKALKGGGAPTGGSAEPEETTSSGGGGKISFDMVKAALKEVMTAHGLPAAKKIIASAGKVKEMAAIKAPQYAAVMKACKELMATADPDEGDGDGDDTL